MPKITNTTNRPERLEQAYQEWKLTGGTLKELSDKYKLFPADLSAYISTKLQLHK